MWPLASLPLQGLARYLPLLAGGATVASQTDPKGLEYLKEGLSSLINPASYSLNPLEDILESKIIKFPEKNKGSEDNQTPNKDPDQNPKIPPSGIGEVLDLIKNKDENKEKEDTRGEGKQYHGAREDIQSLVDGYYNNKNFYGNGFYTTDALDVAKGYKRGKEKGSIYEVIDRKENKLFNLENKMTEKNIKDFENYLGPSLLESINFNLNNFKGKTWKESYDEIRDDLISEDFTADEVTDELDIINEFFAKDGYDGITYKGGKLTGTEPHSVKQYFNPEESIEVVTKKTTENPLEDILESQIQNKEKETYFGTEEAKESFYDVSNNIDVMFDIKELNKPANQKIEYGQNIPAHELYENQYHGGVGDLGNADAFKKLKKLSYYPEYKKFIQEAAKEHLGETFPAYRLVRGDNSAAREGKPSLEKDINSYSLNPEDALSLHNLIDYSEGLGDNRNSLVLQEVYINAKDLVMRGKESEEEIIVNTKKLDTDTVRVFDPFTGEMIKDATKGELVDKELFKFSDKTRLGGKKESLSSYLDFNDDDFIKF